MVIVYTGHEHLGSFGIINMNGRIYDPNTASFFSPDPYVQAPNSTQSFNRYSYCLNNPLMYTDPSGEFIFSAILLGGLINWVSNGFFINSNGKLDWKANWNAKGLGSFAVGALAGGVASGVSALTLGQNFFAGFISNIPAATISSATLAVSTPMAVLSGAASGAAAGLITGTGNALLNNQNIGQSLLAGLKCGGIGAGIGGLTGYLDKITTNKADLMAKEAKAEGHTMDRIISPHPENLNGTWYMGGNNPKMYGNPLQPGGDYLGLVPDWNYNEFAGYLHDITYKNMGIDNGAMSLFLSTKTLGADWALAGRQLASSLRNMDMNGFLWGMGMGVITTYKTALYPAFYLLGR